MEHFLVLEDKPSVSLLGSPGYKNAQLSLCLLDKYKAGYHYISSYSRTNRLFRCWGTQDTKIPIFPHRCWTNAKQDTTRYHTRQVHNTQNKMRSKKSVTEAFGYTHYEFSDYVNGEIQHVIEFARRLISNPALLEEELVNILFATTREIISKAIFYDMERTVVRILLAAGFADYVELSNRDPELINHNECLACERGSNAKTFILIGPRVEAKMKEIAGLSVGKYKSASDLSEVREIDRELTTELKYYAQCSINGLYCINDPLELMKLVHGPHASEPEYIAAVSVFDDTQSRNRGIRMRNLVAQHLSLPTHAEISLSPDARRNMRFMETLVSAYQEYLMDHQYQDGKSHSIPPSRWSNVEGLE